MLKARNSRPQQSHGAGDMRSGHRCATGGRITTVAGIVTRARVSSRSSDIGLYSIATIDGNWPTTAKAGNRIGAGIQCTDCVRSLIKRRRINHGRTTRASIARRDYHLDARCGLSFHGGLETVHRTTFRRRTTPRVGRDIRRFGRVAFVRCAAQWVRRKEKLHALDVPGRRAVALVHVTATDPLRARGHSNLIARAVVPDCCTNRVTPVEEIIARLR